MVLQLLISGLSNGALYALIAFGYVIVFNVTGWLNFPQGQYMFVGAFFTLTFLALGMPMPVAVILAIIATTIIGILFERLTLGRIRQPTFNVSLIILMGGTFLFDGIMMVVWGRYPQAMPPFSEKMGLHLLGAVIPTQSLWMVGITILLGIALWYFFSRQLHGKAMRAAAQNPLAARLVGINKRTMVIIAFALSSGVGAIAGITITPLTFIVYDAGTAVSIMGFVAAVLGGGLASYTGAFVGGLAVGLIESFVTGYVTSLFTHTILFAILIVILIWRPTGLLGRRQT
jgi:branched-chain amino acid transport system permease protein